METEMVMAKGYLERIGIEGSFLTHKVGEEKYKVEKEIKNHADGMQLVIEQLLHKDYGVISSLDEIDAIGKSRDNRFGGRRVSRLLLLVRQYGADGPDDRGGNRRGSL